MTTSWRPRHVQYVPAVNAEALAAAAAGPADALLVDLEDGVLQSHKDMAREICREFLVDPDSSAMSMVRINEAGSDWQDADLEAVVPYATRLLVPKILGPEDVVDLDERLAGKERAAGRPVGQIELFLIVESAGAVLDARRLAQASPRVRGLVLGQADLTVDLGCSGIGARGFEPSPMLLWAQAQVVHAAVAEALPVYVSPWVREGDDTGREAQIRQLLDLGFTGVVVYGAEGVAAAEAARRPTPEQAEFARGALAAKAEAAAAGAGATTYEGWTIEGSYAQIVEAVGQRMEQ